MTWSTFSYTWWPPVYVLWRSVCCTRIAESHQIPREPQIDAITVRNFIISSSRNSLHTTAKEHPPHPRESGEIVFVLCGRGRGKGSLRGLVNSSTKGVLLATDWWVRVRGGGPFLSSPDWLVEFLSL